MEDGVSSPATMLGAPTDSTMDLDFMDELFLDGCWLEATEGPGFPNQIPLSSGAIIDSLSFWPTSGSNGNFYTSPFQTINQAQTPPFNELQEEAPANMQSSSQKMTDVVGFSGQSGNPIMEGHGFSRGIWIGPIANQISAPSVMERLKMALVYMKDIMRDKNVLVQVWLPVSRGGRRVLTTNDILSSHDSSCPSLAKYHDISVNYQFSTGEDSKELVEGLPGRVFSKKVPEWTPDVRFFTSDEYPRLNDAHRYDVCGTVALPIFEQGSQTCLGVIEVVTTTQKVQYQPELDSVCKALKAVDLRSSEKLTTYNIKQVNHKPYQAVLPEIREVLRSACETHNLPLAQTWVSCIQQGKDGCRHSDDNYVHCVSTVDHACHVTDPRIRGFHEACSEHHLLKGQGIVGGAFMTNQPCFSNDVTSLAKTEYPLSHHARMFGLRAAVAIRLRSIHTGSTDFVLEFFLPVDCRDPEEHKKMLTSLSLIIQNICRSLRVVTDKELEEEIDLPVSEVIIPSDPRPSSIASFAEVQQTDNDVFIFPKEEARKMPSPKSSKSRPQDLNIKGVDCDGGFSKLGEGSFSSVGASKTGEKRRTKAEKAITLEVLRKHFSGSLKDAAKSLGVCSTTLKRICRQHGIKRWPSRKIKKVGHSLEKLQRVIDSVQGASGAFQINSFYTNYPELASPNLSGTSPFSTSKLIDQPRPSDVPLEGGVLSPQATASKSPSSSCSQSSSSSQCCSSKTEQHLPTWSVTGSDDPIVGDNRMLKRVRSEAELNALRQIGVEELMQISQSHKNLCERQNLQSFQAPLKYDGQIAQEGDARKVKVTYGDEKTRFRIQNNWRYEDLGREIAKRFGILDMSRFDIKYLDDDSEWVLLTCDADLEECLEVCRSSRCSTIKLSVHLSRRQFEMFTGSSGPS